MSRNKDRLGIPDTTPDNSGPPPQVMQEAAQNSGFSFVVPTEFVEIPSAGRYYPENHPLHNQETIEIKQMTAKEEDMLTSRALLRKGIALDRVMASLVMDKRIDPTHLFVGDRNAILIAARISGYGNEYATKVTCPQCAVSQQYSFDLHNTNIVESTDLSEDKAINNENGTFTLTLPKTKVEVTFRLLTGVDEKALLRQVENARKNKESENAITRQLKQIIVAVNGSTEAEHINYVVNNIPSSDSRYLRNIFAEATPNVDLTQHYECGNCGYEQDMEVPLTADFFWPDR